MADLTEQEMAEAVTTPLTDEDRREVRDFAHEMQALAKYARDELGEVDVLVAAFSKRRATLLVRVILESEPRDTPTPTPEGAPE